MSAVLHRRRGALERADPREQQGPARQAVRTDRGGVAFVGLQAVGKRNGFGFSVLDVQSQEHRPDGTIEDVNAAVVRVQRDLRLVVTR